jgi:hypothetical protein
VIENLIAFSSIGLGALFFLVWLLSKDFRAWLERPKYRFLQNLRSYDQAQRRPQ